MLDYKASNIRKAERENGLNLFTALKGLDGDPSISVLAFLFEAGGGSMDEFDKLFAEGIDAVYLAIMEGINAAGFLGKIDTASLKKAMDKAKEELQRQNVSPTTGETAKAQPSK